MLHDRFMSGVHDLHIKLCLLLELDLTLKTAMQIVLGVETAAQNAKTLQGGGEASTATLGEVLKFTGCKPGGSKQQMPSCTCCGKLNPLPCLGRTVIAKIDTTIFGPDISRYF